MKRILFTMAIGKPKFAECALGLGRSLKLIGDTTPRVVVTDQLEYPWDRSFDQVLPPERPLQWTLLGKLDALRRTDADQVLFVDADSLAFKRLGPIFDHCAGKGLCVQGKLITGGNWYGGVSGHLAKFGLAAMPQFNGGMIYYERSSACEAMLAACLRQAEGHADSGFLYDSQLIPEEPYLSVAMAKAGFAEGTAYLIPDEMNFTNSATGLIGKLELDVMRNRCAFICRRFGVRYVQPSIFHASRYINFAVYWKQLERLAWLERYEDEHEFGYMPPLHRLQRSVHRRYLKYIKRVL